MVSREGLEIRRIEMMMKLRSWETAGTTRLSITGVRHRKTHHICGCWAMENRVSLWV